MRSRLAATRIVITLATATSLAVPGIGAANAAVLSPTAAMAIVHVFADTTTAADRDSLAGLRAQASSMALADRQRLFADVNSQLPVGPWERLRALLASAAAGSVDASTTLNRISSDISGVAWGAGSWCLLARTIVWQSLGTPVADLADMSCDLPPGPLDVAKIALSIDNVHLGLAMSAVELDTTAATIPMVWRPIPIVDPSAPAVVMPGADDEVRDAAREAGLVDNIGSGGIPGVAKLGDFLGKKLPDDYYQASIGVQIEAQGGFQCDGPPIPPMPCVPTARSTALTVVNIVRWYWSELRVDVQGAYSPSRRAYVQNNSGYGATLSWDVSKSQEREYYYDSQPKYITSGWASKINAEFHLVFSALYIPFIGNIEKTVWTMRGYVHVYAHWDGTAQLSYSKSPWVCQVGDYPLTCNGVFYLAEDHL
jgi:hypothetical protein